MEYLEVMIFEDAATDIPSAISECINVCMQLEKLYAPAGAAYIAFNDIRDKENWENEWSK